LAAIGSTKKSRNAPRKTVEPYNRRDAVMRDPGTDSVSLHLN
jgi:hypothetical protein